jgi:hypothetical protein
VLFHVCSTISSSCKCGIYACVFGVLLLLLLLLLLQQKYGYSRVAMVGDGATDLEARLPDAANIFVG